MNNSLNLFFGHFLCLWFFQSVAVRPYLFLGGYLTGNCFSASSSSASTNGADLVMAGTKWFRKCFQPTIGKQGFLHILSQLMHSCRLEQRQSLRHWLLRIGLSCKRCASLPMRCFSSSSKVAKPVWKWLDSTLHPVPTRSANSENGAVTALVMMLANAFRIRTTKTEVRIIRFTWHVNTQINHAVTIL